MSIIDTLNRVYREFKRYTGDGLPGEPTGAPLPVGDPQSGPHSPKKSEIRGALIEFAADVEEDAERAEDAADRAEIAAGTAVAAGARFPTVDAMLADTGMAYSGGTLEVAAGDIVKAQGFRYEVAADAAPDEDLNTAGGVALYLRRNADLTVYSEQAGIDATETSATAINTMLAKALAAGARTVKMAKGDWTPDGQLIWPVGLKELDWQGGLITQNADIGSGQAAIKYSDALVVLPALSADISSTTEIIVFASAHGLQVGDVIGFRNTTISSLNAWRTSYYDGQQTIVREVVSSTQITVADTIDPRGALKAFPSASTEVVLYPRSSRGIAFRNAVLRGSTSVFAMLDISGGTHLELENIDGHGGNNAVGILRLGAYARSERCIWGHVAPVVGTQYGLSHDGFSFHKSFGTTAYAERHAIAHGNSDGVGALPPRGNEHYAVNLGSERSEALDFGHGNILDHRCVGGTITSLGLGGSNNHVDVDVISTAKYPYNGNWAVVGTNFHDTNHFVRAGRILVPGDGTTDGATPFSQGIIGFGGTASNLSANTVDGGTIDVSIGTLEARNWSQTTAPLTRFRNRGFSGMWGLKVHVKDIVCPVEPAWFACDVVSGSNPVRIDLGDGPTRWDPSGSPTHGWNAANQGFTIPAILSPGGKVTAPRLVKSVADTGGAAPRLVSSGAVFAGLKFTDDVSCAASANIGNFTVGKPFVVNATTVATYVSGSGSLPAMTWTFYVTKTP